MMRSLQRWLLAALSYALFRAFDAPRYRCFCGVCRLARGVYALRGCD